jgi:hypothetical protein
MVVADLQDMAPAGESHRGDELEVTAITSWIGLRPGVALAVEQRGGDAAVGITLPVGRSRR